MNRLDRGFDWHHHAECAGGHYHHSNGQLDLDRQEDGQQELSGKESRGYQDSLICTVICKLQDGQPLAK